MFVYFDFKNRMKIEIDAFNFVIATILSQLMFRFVNDVKITIKIKNYCYKCNAYELKISSYENYAKIFTLCVVKFRILTKS